MSVAALTSTSPAVLAAIIGGAAVIGAALIAGYIELRSQSADDQLEAIKRTIEQLAERYSDQIIDQLERRFSEALDARSRGLIIGEIVKRALREVLAADPHGRRWYDGEGD